MGLPCGTYATAGRGAGTANVSSKLMEAAVLNSTATGGDRRVWWRYSPGLVIRTSHLKNLRLTFSGPENKTLIRLNGYAYFPISKCLRT